MTETKGARVGMGYVSQSFQTVSFFPTLKIPVWVLYVKTNKKLQFGGPLASPIHYHAKIR